MIRAGINSKRILALLDSGSQVTLVRADVVNELGLTGEIEKIRLSTFHGRDPDLIATNICFTLESEDGDWTCAMANALAVPHLNLTRSNVDWQVEKARKDHVADLDLPQTDDRPILMLLGMNVKEAHLPVEVRRSKTDTKGPYAMRTVLGWTVFGSRPSYLVVNDSTRERHTSCNAVALYSLLKSLFEVDTRALPAKEDGKFVCRSDKRAMKQLETTTKDLGGRYEVGLLWATDNFSIPNNRPLALQRPFANEQRFARDPAYAVRYSKIINEYIDLGYARPLHPTELAGPEGKTNYLVHFGVTNPNKPDKLRVVFNAALQFKGNSLNDLLLPGPDFLTSLIGVLLRFHVSAIGVSADIEKMFLQVKVP